MKRILHYSVALGLGVLVSTTWIATSVAARHAPSIYGALALQYLLAALAGVVSYLIAHGARLPLISYRTFQASVALSVLSQLLPGIFVYFALTRLPSVLGAFAFSIVPLFLWIFKLGVGKSRPLFLGLALIGILLFFWGAPVGSWTLMERGTALFLLIFAAFIYAVGVVIFRRVFWIHAGPELLLWSSFITFLVSIFLAYVFAPQYALPAQPRYFMAIAYIGLVVLAVGGHVYRWATSGAQFGEEAIIAIVVPLGALMWSGLLYKTEVPLNIFTIGGLGLFIVTIIAAAKTENPHHWMCFYLRNSLRRGDRVSCKLGGFAKLDKGGLNKIEVTDISVGGLGFRCEHQYKVSDDLTITIPMGQTWSQLAVECHVTHYHKSTGDSHFSGGGEFRNLPDHVRYILIETIARMGNVGV